MHERKKEKKNWWRVYRSTRSTREWDFKRTGLVFLRSCGLYFSAGKKQQQQSRWILANQQSMRSATVGHWLRVIVCDLI